MSAVSMRCPDARRTERQDWSMEGRADLGHGVIDVAPGVKARHPCAIVWFAWQLDVPDSHNDRLWLKYLLDRMTNVGILSKSGGVYQCQECPRTHQSPCAYQLLVGRHDAHERWAEVVQRQRWWHHTGSPDGP